MSARESLLDRFVRYVKIDTQSSDSSTTYPSTEKQKDLCGCSSTISRPPASTTRPWTSGAT